jgi:hypothetical protein
VDRDRDAFTIVPDTDFVLLLVYINLDVVHLGIPLKVVSGVNDNLVEDLVQTWHILDFTVLHFLFLIAVDPQILLLPVNTTDVSVRSE